MKNKAAAILELVALGKKGVKMNRSSKCVLLEKGLEAFYEACRAKKLAAISYDMLITKSHEIGDQLVACGTCPIELLWLPHKRYLYHFISFYISTIVSLSAPKLNSQDRTIYKLHFHVTCYSITLNKTKIR